MHPTYLVEINFLLVQEVGNFLIKFIARILLTTSSKIYEDLSRYLTHTYAFILIPSNSILNFLSFLSKIDFYINIWTKNNTVKTHHLLEFPLGYQPYGSNLESFGSSSLLTIFSYYLISYKVSWEPLESCSYYLRSFFSFSSRSFYLCNLNPSINAYSFSSHYFPRDMRSFSAS
jgi:hypothetical protein